MKKKMEESLDDEHEGPVSPLEARADEGPPTDDMPLWAAPHLPEDFRIPPGRQVAFMRFPSAWTDAPDKGVLSTYARRVRRGEDDYEVVETEELSRIIVCWPISDLEERLAMQRTRGEPGRSYDELTKQMIRAVDGRRADWSGTWAKKPDQLIDVKTVWSELGAKCRQPLLGLYRQLHQLSTEQSADFFLHCLVVTSAVAG